MNETTKCKHEDLEEIQKQFLGLNPLQKFDWKGVLNSLQNNLELQQHLTEITVNLPRVKRYPVKISYQKLFLKKIINELESKGSEVIEDIYSAYCNLLESDKEIQSSTEQGCCFRHYVMPPGAAVASLVLQESASMLSSGTTGLSSWQAGVALAEWCVSHRPLLEDRCVLELGSGCGLTGLVAAVVGGAAQVVLSDCHEAVLTQLSHNVHLNLPPAPPSGVHSSRERARAEVGATRVSVLNLPWEEVASARDLPVPDIILAADVVFDPSTFSDLKDALLHLLSLKQGGSTAVLACTLRNAETLNSFLQLLSSNNLTWTQEQDTVDQVFYYDRSCPVLIYRLQQGQS